MGADDLQMRLREEYSSVEAQLAQLRRSSEDARREIGGRGAGAVDPEDLAAALTSVEEQEAVINALEGRRLSLLRRLGEA